MPRRTRKDRRQKSKVLEQCVDVVRMVGFHVYTNGQFERLPEEPDRYVRQPFPHVSLYGTPGRKEALIVAKGLHRGFVHDADFWTRVVLEAKWQEGSGSVDEKLPYVWQSFLESPVRNWVLVLDGNYWQRDSRGKAAFEWATAQVAPPNRTWHVVNRKAFTELAKGAWGGR